MIPVIFPLRYAFLACDLLYFVTSLPNLFAQTGFTLNDFEHHRDEENGFYIIYPKSWAKVPTTHAATKLKALSENGGGTEDISVVVVSDPAFATITPERLVAMSVDRPEAVLGLAAKDFPDAKLIKSGRTKLNNREAFFIVYDATFRSPGLDLPMRMFQVSTVHGGRAYYVTCRAAQPDFATFEPLFTVMLSTFRFDP